MGGGKRQVGGVVGFTVPAQKLKEFNWNFNLGIVNTSLKILKLY